MAARQSKHLLLEVAIPDLKAMIHVKRPQHNLSLYQLDKFIEYGQRKGLDVWGLDTEQDARMAALNHIDPAQMDEALARIPRLESMPKEEVLDILFERNLGSGMKFFITTDWTEDSTARAQELKNKYAKICLMKMTFASIRVLLDLGAQRPTILNKDIKERVLPKLNRKAIEPFHSWVGAHVLFKSIDTNWEGRLRAAFSIFFTCKGRPRSHSQCGT